MGKFFKNRIMGKIYQGDSKCMIVHSYMCDSACACEVIC